MMSLCDAEADALNRGVAAVAFTVGADIFFRAGFYQPRTPAGQHLLAHELTHVAQQRMGSLGTSGGGSGGTMTVGAADDRHEQEAEATAHRVVAALQHCVLLAQATIFDVGIARRHGAHPAQPCRVRSLRPHCSADTEDDTMGDHRTGVVPWAARVGEARHPIVGRGGDSHRCILIPTPWRGPEVGGTNWWRERMGRAMGTIRPIPGRGRTSPRGRMSSPSARRWGWDCAARCAHAG